jgi:CheY-like chemotaxis protein/anti-sigma regulatory factor (Ser/Thr protein kinase)
VVSNLVGNAAKYTPPSGRIAVSLDLREGEVVLKVVDNGIGIDPEILPRVFESFTQDRRNIDRSPGGLGLGLTIARRIVDLHGGKITVESAGPGCGTTVEVSLPVLSGGGDAGLTVLVVDDNVDAAQILREVVEMGGHRAVMAFDGETALALARSEKPDIALLDLGLPGLSGYELARAIRAEPELEGMQIVAISGYATDADRELSAEAGFDAHLAKPLALDVLFKTVPALKSR